MDTQFPQSYIWLAVVGAVMAKLGMDLFYKHKRRSLMPPGPTGIPLIGNLVQVLGSRSKRLLFTDWKRQFGPLYSLDFGGQPVIVLNSMEVAIELLEHRQDIYNDRPPSIMGGKLMTCNLFFLFTPTGQLHARLRRAAQEGLTPRMSRTYFGMQEREAAIFIQNLVNDPGPWQKEINRTFLSSVLTVLYGWPPLQDMNAPIINEIRESMERIERAAIPGTYLIDTFPFLLYLPKWLSLWKREGAYYYQRITALSEGVLDEVREKRAQLPGCFAMTMLDKVDEGDLSKAEAAWTLGTLLGGGTETSGDATRWFVLAMLLYPDVMHQAQAEIDQVVGRERMPNFEDMEFLPYVQAIVRETLRWKTIIPLGVPHRTTKDDVYKGYLIPKGSIIFPNIWGIYNDENEYTAAQSFRPERFLDEAGKLKAFGSDTHGQGHISYGFGKRVCPGMHFANQALFINMASILWAFDLKDPVDADDKPLSDPETIIVENGTLLAASKYNCTFTPRFQDVGDLVQLECAKRACE